MKIALIGASGFIGQAILAEAATRQHEVTAIARHPQKIPSHEGVRPLAADVSQRSALQAAVADQDLVILSIKYAGIQTQPLLRALKETGVPRLLAVGGAGSLINPTGVQVVDCADFPIEWKAEAVAARDFLLLLQQEKELEWSYLSPSAIIEDGKRTGRFRLGRDQLLIDERGDSRISIQDYAIALLDEAERPAHRRQRFTVGY